MAKKRVGSPEELKASIDTRVAARLLARHEQQMALLHLANQFPPHGDPFDSSLAETILLGQEHLLALRNQIIKPIAKRRRPSAPVQSGPEVTVFLDECGSHSLSAQEDFNAFALAAVIVKDDDIPAMESLWAEWKKQTFGTEAAIIHEPEVRRGNRKFFFGGDTARRDNAYRTLARTIEDSAFTAIVCVLNRSEYVSQFGDDRLDASLPPHMYLMMLDFIAERIALALDTQFAGAHGKLVVESRGGREDALLQYEFARLHLEGTSYLSDAWFRMQLEPGIRFQTKQDNLAGLQVADLIARPCAEKVIDPTSDPPRWAQVCPKLCRGQETAHSILGLKIVPWAEKYDRIWES